MFGSTTCLFGDRLARASFSRILWTKNFPASAIPAPVLADVSNHPAKPNSSQNACISAASRLTSISSRRSHLFARRTTGIGEPSGRCTFSSMSRFQFLARSNEGRRVTSNTTIAATADLKYTRSIRP
eukprot:Amastigsp_a508518_472.p5 type:complete len:127 gc:universal Amastigsp_a508518_472:693-313(-)